MLRIRGTIGEWPVDLTLELDEGDWAHLGSQLMAAKSQAIPASVAPVSQDEAAWNTAKDLLRQAGQISGPELLGLLEGLTGNIGSAKRLLVRLRHCAQVKVVSGTDAPLYSWV